MSEFLFRVVLCFSMLVITGMAATLIFGRLAGC